MISKLGIPVAFVNISGCPSEELPLLSGLVPTLLQNSALSPHPLDNWAVSLWVKGDSSHPLGRIRCGFLVDKSRTVLICTYFTIRRSKMDQSSFVYLSKGSMDGINKPEDA